MYQGTRLGRQELEAEVLDTSESVRFPTFDTARHVMERAEYVPGLPVRLAIDCGLSRHVGALFFQVRERDGAVPGSVRRIVSVFADYYAVDRTSADNALAIVQRAHQVCGGRLDHVYLDPASTARSGVGPAARGEFARVLGERITSTWPVHRVLEGLDQVEILLGAPPREPDLWIHRRAPSSSRASAPTSGPSSGARSSTYRPIPSTPPRRPSTPCGGPSAPSSPRGGSSRPGSGDSCPTPAGSSDPDGRAVVHSCTQSPPLGRPTWPGSAGGRPGTPGETTKRRGAGTSPSTDDDGDVHDLTMT